MVGVSFSPSQDPVAFAHAAVNRPGATVSSVLQSLQPPPLHLIPHVDDVAAKPGAWAQCVAMVQDIWDTELFVSSSPDGCSGLLVENGAATDNAQAKLAERLPVYLVTPPGQTNWARAAASSQNVAQEPAQGLARSKRPREDDDTEMSDSRQPSAQPTPGMSASAGAASSPNTEKRPKASADDNSHKRSSTIGLNLPLPGQHGASAVVAKMYDDNVGRNLRINTIVRVVGILQEPLSLALESEGDPTFAEEFAARNPNNVKRLHVVSAREASEQELNPATAHVIATGGEPAIQQARAELQGVLCAVRDLAIRYLASALFDDVLAAEYLFMCLLSRPALRTNAGVALGKLSLNVIVPSEAIDQQPQFLDNLAAAIGNVCPAVVPVDLSIAALNARELFPRKDYSLNRLRAAPLQLCSGSVLLADETRLSDGQLSERGVKNVRALTRVSQACVAPVNFQFYESELPVNCCSIFVSRGGKSIIPCDVSVRVQPSASLGLQRWNEYGDDLLKKIRLALALLAEGGDFDIADATSKAVEEEYVKARRNGLAKDGQETLQRWLGVARCCARSFGENMLGVERWRYTWELEQKRNSRVKV